MGRARWEDLATRARGLATHLLRRADLDALARARGLDEIGETLRARGFLPPDVAVTPESLELAVRRTAAARLQILGRWAGPRSALLAVIFGDEDRRSVRALLRGTLQHAPPEERIAGLIPTPALPERALAELAAQPGVRAIATLLTAWGHDFGPVLLPGAASPQPDPLALEYQLNSAFALRALRGARGSRNRALLEYVRETIDLENAVAALVLAAAESDITPKAAFIAGGRRLPLAAFLDAVSARESAEAGRRLAAAFGPAALAAVFERGAREPQAIERALLRHRIAAQTRAARLDPAGPASVLSFALRLRAEVLDLRRIIWGVMLDAPRGDIANALVAV